MNTRIAGVVALATIVLAGVGQVEAALESEPNDTFFTRQVFPIGTSTVSGTMALAYDYHWDGFLPLSEVNQHVLAGLTAPEFFYAWMDNDPLNPIDTLLGRFDESGNLLEYDEDSSPIGSGQASALGGEVNSDGTIDLRVTAYGDPDFDGGHSYEGPYDLYVRLGRTTWDVDYLSFSELVPGTPFTAEITSGTFNTVLGMFDPTGLFLDSDDDGGAGQLSKLTGTIDGTGELHLAVSGYDDSGFSGFIGDHAQSGDYVLTLSTQAIPEPSILVALTGLVGMGLLGRWWGRRKRA
jgi:hypothetical protein